jgi:hypothetical protein
LPARRIGERLSKTKALAIFSRGDQLVDYARRRS